MHAMIMIIKIKHKIKIKKIKMHGKNKKNKSKMGCERGCRKRTGGVESKNEQTRPQREQRARWALDKGSGLGTSSVQGRTEPVREGI